MSINFHFNLHFSVIFNSEIMYVMTLFFSKFSFLHLHKYPTKIFRVWICRRFFIIGTFLLTIIFLVDLFSLYGYIVNEEHLEPSWIDGNRSTAKWFTIWYDMRKSFGSINSVLMSHNTTNCGRCDGWRLYLLVNGCNNGSVDGWIDVYPHFRPKRVLNKVKEWIQSINLN